MHGKPQADSTRPSRHLVRQALGPENEAIVARQATQPGEALDGRPTSQIQLEARGHSRRQPRHTSGRRVFGAASALAAEHADVEGGAGYEPRAAREFELNRAKAEPPCQQPERS